MASNNDPIKINVKITGDDTLLLRVLSEAPERFKKEMEDSLFKLGSDMRNHIILGMRNTKKAPWSYPRQKGRKKHYPSLPNNFPAIDSGNLLEMIKSYSTSDFLEVGALDEVPYAKYLEKGTKKMKPRPFIAPTYKHFKPRIENTIMDAIRKTIKK